MNRSKRIFGYVQKRLPGSTLCGEFLVVGTTEMILRGFLLLRTGRKNHVDLRRVVLPLWQPRERPMSNFNEQLHQPGTGWTILDPKDHARSAATVLAQIAPLVDELKTIQTALDFRAHFAFMRPNPMVTVQIDFALADYLAGDMEGCEKALSYVEGILAEHQKFYDYCRPIVAQIRGRLDSGPAGLRDLIQQWREENVAMLGLEPSC